LPLPSVLGAGDPGAALAALAVQCGQAQRSAATDARNADEALVEADDQRDVQSLRAEARSMWQQAWLDGATAIFEGTAGGKATTLGTVAAGVKGLGDGLYAADEKNDEASAKGFEAGAHAAQFAEDNARDASSGAASLIQAALDFYKEYVSTEGQTSEAALRAS
jgi:hypothetical protein